jgi:hypothetical protein
MTRGTKPPGRLRHLAYGLVPVNVRAHRASRTPSIFLARVGVTRVADTLARTVLVGLAAMALSLLAGWLLHP